jgi:hypothetical protein
MTGHLVSALARRGVQAIHQHAPKDPKEVLKNIPGWGIALLATTLVILFIFGASIEYTVRLLTGHLAMVESTEPTVVQAYTPVYKDDEDTDMKKDGQAPLEIETTTGFSGKPLTSNIRRTVFHLVSIGGRTAKWRGAGVFVLYVFLTNLISIPLSFIFSSLPLPIGPLLGDIGAAVITSRLHCAWTHKIITMPSSKSLKARRISREQWRSLMGPTALSVGAQSVGLCGIAMVFRMSVLLVNNLYTNGSGPKWVLPIIAIVPGALTSVILGLFLMLPAYVSLVRMEASLLPEEDETIVPFDRSFGGRITSVGTAATLREAWQSFTWEARRRLVGLYVKFFFIMVAFFLVAVQILSFESYLVAGDEIKDFARAARAAHQEGQML